MDESNIVVIGCHWRQRHTELTFVTRSIAAAASRWANVWVLVAGDGPDEPDGAFDLYAMNERAESRWREVLSSNCVVVIDDLTPEIAAVLSKNGPRTVFYLASPEPEPDQSWRRLPLAEDQRVDRPFVKVYLPINPLAQLHRHNGFGFTGYQLVLSGQTRPGGEPPPAAAWLTAAFHDDYVIVVEGATASAWKGRALRGRVNVDTRMDLWRLIAHANVCIDLAPGPYIARECIEAMRLGTPIIVPRESGPAVVHALSGGGATFDDPEELIQAAAALQTDAVRSSRSRLSQVYADANYGEPSEFMASLRALLLDD